MKLETITDYQKSMDETHAHVIKTHEKITMTCDKLEASLKKYNSEAQKIASINLKIQLFHDFIGGAK